jgi:GxxExxY protein
MPNRLTQITDKNMTDENFLEKDLSYKVIGAIYSVANKYGCGLKEIVYQKALAEEFEKLQINCEQQKRINIYSLDSGKVLGVYIPDFLIENKIILEIKATPFTTRQNIEQQRSYLRASQYEIGYLANFNTIKLEIKRSIFTNNRKSFITLISKTQS